MPGLNRYFSDDFSFQDPDVKVNGIEGMLLLISYSLLSSIFGRVGTDFFGATSSSDSSCHRLRTWSE